MSLDTEMAEQIVKLNEANKILKRALELACNTIENIMPTKPMYICGDYFARKYNIPNEPTIKDYEYFIEQAKESLK